MQGNSPPNSNTKADNIALTNAVRILDHSTAKLLLNNGANPNTLNPYGIPLLMLAHRSATMTMLLLSAGAKINATNRDGVTSLMMAAAGGCPDHQFDFDDYLGALYVLLSAGANINQAAAGQTALMDAVIHDQLESVAALIRYGADVDIQNNAGCSALHFALTNQGANQNPIIQHLINAGCSTNIQDRNGFSPIMAAVLEDKPTILELLIQSGADINATDNTGATAYQLCKILLDEAMNDTQGQGIKVNLRYTREFQENIAIGFGDLTIFGNQHGASPVVTLKSIKENSPAHIAGVKPGDIIVAIHGDVLHTSLRGISGQQVDSFILNLNEDLTSVMDSGGTRPITVHFERLHVLTCLNILENALEEQNNLTYHQDEEKHEEEEEKNNGDDECVHMMECF